MNELKILEFLLKTSTIARLSKELNVSSMTIHRWLKKDNDIGRLNKIKIKEYYDKLNS